MDNIIESKKHAEQKTAQDQSPKTDIPKQVMRYTGFLFCIKVNEKRWQELAEAIEEIIKQQPCSYKHALMVLFTQSKIDEEEYSYFKCVSPQELVLHCRYILDNFAYYLAPLSEVGSLHFYAYQTKLPRSFMLAFNPKTGKI